MKQRELKFRAWVDNDDGYAKMEYFTLYDRVRQYCDGYPVMQYTGLMDQNYKEIYEGDIYELEFPEDNATFGPVNVEYMKFLRNISNAELRRLTVIGNIYENPELKESLLNS